MIMKAIKTAARHFSRLFAETSAFRFHIALSAALSVCAATGLFFHWDQHVQGSTYDWMVKHRFHTPHADSDIVIIDVDERSLSQLRGEFGSWPWPRDIFAAVLAELESQKAQAVVFDILFADPDRPKTEGDHALTEVVARSHISYFPVLRLNPANDALSSIRATDHPGLVTAEPGTTPSPDRTLALVFPYFASAVAQDRFGTFNVVPEADGVMRHYALWGSTDDWRIASLPMRVGSVLGWPLPQERTHLLQWASNPLAYKTVSFADVYSDSQRKNKLRPQDEFKGKIVLIGSTASGLSDVRGTSLSAMHPGVDILATAIDNLKNRHYMHELPRWQQFAATIALLMLATWLSLRTSGMRLTLAFASLPLLLFGLAYLSLNTLDTFIDFTVSAYYIVAYFIIAKLHELYVAQKEKAQAQAAALQSQQIMLDTLRQSEKELERKVVDRTEALEQKNDELNNALSQLTTQKEVAESANLAKSRFLAAASHDLRQPMHTISLLVGLLRDQMRHPDAHQIVGKIHASVQAMGGMFDSLLDISKFDAGVVTPHMQTFAIGSLLDRIAATYEAQAHEKKLTLKIAPSNAHVTSDPVLLERILGNLVSNAIRYTEQGGVLVGCRRRGRNLLVQVWDTGIGIDESQHNNIFEEFFQLANPERDRSKGLGLGLSIARRSASLLGHSLTVCSIPGKGSVFSIALPISDENDAGYAVASSAAAPTDLLARAFIVVVDDSTENREATEALLRHWGCHVVSAASADDAVAALQNHLRMPDLIFCDYRLRDGIDGVTAVRQIRQWAEDNIPAIIVTGDMAIHREQIREADIELLHKPVNALHLQQLAEELLRKR